MDLLNQIVNGLLSSLSKASVLDTVEEALKKELEYAKKQRVFFYKKSSQFDRRHFEMWDCKVKDYEESLYYLTRSNFDHKGINYSNVEDDL